MTNILRAKLLVVGDSAVGKTAVVQQFANSGAAFPKNYSMTLGADVVTKTINIPDTSDAVELVMVDCSGKAVNHDILAKVSRLTSPITKHRALKRQFVYSLYRQKTLELAFTSTVHQTVKLIKVYSLQLHMNILQRTELKIV